MKTITDYINESMLLESFGSEKLNALFHNDRGKLDWDFKNYLSREMQWDKITDDDIEEMETEDARKLAYKRDSMVYIIWLDPSGHYLGRSIGNFTIMMNYNLRQNIRNTVKSLSMASDKAIVIKDSEKFSTSEIRKIRTEQKKNAIALMSDVEVKKENLERYRKIIQDNKIADINMGDIADSVNDVLEKYSKMVSSISGELVAANDYRSIVDRLNEMDEDIQRIMNWFKEILKRKADYDKYKKWEVLASGYRSDILRAVDELNKNIDKFNQKYGSEE